MKTAFEHNKELIRTIKPRMSYDGGDLLKWQIDAKEKLATLMGMDKIIFISDGKIVGVGTHEELLRTSSAYANTVELQRLEYGEGGVK